MANQLGLRLLVAPGPGDALRLAGARRAGRARCGRGVLRHHAPAPGRRRGAARRRGVTAGADGAGRRPVPGVDGRGRRREHPQLRRRHGPAARRDPGAARRHAGASASPCTSTARGCGTRTSASGVPLADVRARCSTPSRSASPRGSGRRSARCWSGRPRDGGGAGLAQAVRRRDAPGRDPRGGRPVRARPPRRAAGRRPRACPSSGGRVRGGAPGCLDPARWRRTSS